MRAALVDRPIDIGALVSEVARTSNGATLIFVGTVRDVNNGRAITGMDYTAYNTMAERELAEITQEAFDKFENADIVVEHRLGKLTLGDASVVIVVAHAHRAPTYEASRYVIEQLKQRVPIWKREHYVDGSHEWVGASTGARPVQKRVDEPDITDPEAVPSTPVEQEVADR